MCSHFCSWSQCSSLLGEYRTKKRRELGANKSVYNCWRSKLSGLDQIELSDFVVRSHPTFTLSTSRREKPAKQGKRTFRFFVFFHPPSLQSAIRFWSQKTENVWNVCIASKERLTVFRRFSSSKFWIVSGFCVRAFWDTCLFAKKN